MKIIVSSDIAKETNHRRLEIAYTRATELLAQGAKQVEVRTIGRHYSTETTYIIERTQDGTYAYFRTEDVLRKHQDAARRSGLPFPTALNHNQWVGAEVK